RFQEVRGPARFTDLRALPPTRRLPQAPRQPRTTNHLTAPRSRKIRAAHAAQRSKRSNKRCAYRARAAHAAQRSKRAGASPPPTPPRFGEGRPVFAFSPFPLREGGRGVRSFRPIKAARSPPLTPLRCVRGSDSLLTVRGLTHSQWLPARPAQRGWCAPR